MCVIHPTAANPVLINFFKAILFLASDSSSGSARVFHISLQPQPREWEKKTKKNKKQTNNMGLCQLQPFTVFPVHRCRVFCAKLLQKGTKNADIFLCWLTGLCVAHQVLAVTFLTSVDSKPTSLLCPPFAN